MDKKTKMGTPSLMIRREAIKSINGFDETLPRHQDWDLLIRLFEIGKIKVLPEHLWIWYEHEKPGVQIVMEAKNKYLKKHKRRIEKFTRKEKNNIYQNHFLALSYLLLKERGYRKALFYLKKSINHIPPLPKLNSISKLFLGFFEGLFNKKLRYKFR